MFFDPFSLMFSIFPLIVIVLFVVVLVRGLREWSRNNASPRLSVPATVVTKRRAHHHNANQLGPVNISRAWVYPTVYCVVRRVRRRLRGTG